MKEKIEVYTAITGDKDAPRNDIKVFKEYKKFVQPVMNAKIYKVLPHKFLDCDISIWMDGNIFMNLSKEEAVKRFLGDNDMALFIHNHCKSIYYELKFIRYALRKRPRWILDEVEDQIKHYESIGFPGKTGMALCGVLIRRHNDRVRRFNEAWWAEICRWSQRDQISFPVILTKHPDLKVNYIQKNLKDNKYFRYTSHKQFDT